MPARLDAAGHARVPASWEPGPRSRLMAGMAVAVARQGLVETRVADVLALTGSSRRTFYAHFQNRDDCFLATYDAVRDDAFGLIAPCDGDIDGALAGLLGHFSAWPAHARVVTFEILAAGPAGLRRHEETMARLATLLQHAGRPCGPGGLPVQERFEALVGGAHRLVQRRLAAREEAMLPRLAQKLAALFAARGGDAT
jgi:AcrR family transcriptional regulator